MPSLEIFEMRVRVHDVTAREPCGLGRRQLHGDRLGDLFSQLTLQCEYVFELSVVTIGPERFVGACGDELNTQPYTPADEMCRAFENRLDVQFLGDFRERQRGPL